MGFVDDEGAIPLLELANVFEAGHRGAIWPADFEVGRPIERIVDRAGEAKVVVEQRFDSGTVFVYISLQAGSSDRESGFSHDPISFHPGRSCGTSESNVAARW